MQDQYIAEKKVKQTGIIDDNHSGRMKPLPLPFLFPPYAICFDDKLKTHLYFL